jgi:hypothetical protein
MTDILMRSMYTSGIEKPTQRSEERAVREAMSVECAQNGQTFEIKKQITSPFPDIRKKIKEMDDEYNTCQCQFGTLNRKDQKWARDRFPDHQKVKVGNYNAIFKPGYQEGYKSDIGIILICDALGAEMSGSRTLMEALGTLPILNEDGEADRALGTLSVNVIKPMIYENDHNTFMNMLVSYYFKAEKPKTFPPEIQATINFLKERNITKIGIVGVCWGGCITQHIMSVNKMDSLLCAISVDGLYRNENYSALIPSKYVCGYEGIDRFNSIHHPMAEIMHNFNPYPHEIDLLEYPDTHGTLLKGYYIIECDLDDPENLPEPKNLAENAVKTARWFSDDAGRYLSEYLDQR